MKQIWQDEDGRILNEIVAEGLPDLDPRQRFVFDKTAYRPIRARWAGDRVVVTLIKDW